MTAVAKSTIDRETATKYRAGHRLSNLIGEIDVDNFAGGGGVGMGFEDAMGKPFDVAINHDPHALHMHELNHPGTRHICESVWNVHPVEVCAGLAVRLAWFSPDCTPFSRAKGAKPVKKNIRCLAWVVIKWAKMPEHLRPLKIILENVREFLDWGPLIQQECPDGHGWLWQVTMPKAPRAKRSVVETVPGPHRDQYGTVREFRAAHRARGAIKIEPCLIPDPARKGDTFKRWSESLRRRGYTIEWRVLDCADYGDPTHRKRLFLIARRDGDPVWPEKTHGPGRASPWRTAAECIDWSIPCPSIFSRKRDLVPATCRRVAMGMIRYVLANANPFTMPVNHGDGWERPGNRTRDRPAATITASRGEYLVAPVIAQTGYGERAGQAPRAISVEQPLGTVVADGGKHAVATAFLAQGYSGMVGKPLTVPCPTITAKDHNWLVSATLVKWRGDSDGQPVDRPCPTITSGHGALRPAGAAHALGVASCWLTRIGQQGGNGTYARGVETPLSTITSKAEHCLTTAYMVRMNHGDKQWNGVDESLSTITSGGNKAVCVVAVLNKFYSTGGQLSAVDSPSPTITTKHRLALTRGDCADAGDEFTADELQRAMRVGAFLALHGGDKAKPYLVPVVSESGEAIGCVAVARVDGREYLVVDIGLRMLTPRELARCQGFPDTYILTGTQSNQVAKIGNSVPPGTVAALVRANVGTANASAPRRRRRVAA